jgi:hypothetical protein
METATNGSIDTRELTKTEIEIAAAQIADRFVRYVSAIQQHEEWCIERDAEEKDDKRIMDSINDARSRHDIPAGVAFLCVECQFTQSDVNGFKKWFRYWVAGTLTQEDMDDMHFYFAECDEIDFCWVFMDKPSFYYSWQTGEKPHGFDLNALIREWFEVGMRTRRKHTGKTFAQEMNPSWYRTPTERAAAEKAHPVHA